MFYRFQASGVKVFKETVYKNQMGNMHFGDFADHISDHILCNSCFVRLSAKTPDSTSCESTEYCINVVCDREELEFFKIKYGKACCECKQNAMYTITKVNPRNTSHFETFWV